ncbi:hypothetical protein [Flavobacterium sp. 14A]|uniref:hypothetical protein n=1 Tax=Flavobacterium sp. 14A TaxID=2735896 RepID=UPI00156FCA13|nr:hypothetical protein [Flavobacterium sp. 14A]NRT13571.1 hypothetical protein [Flavobacterium sp. 14A]
MIKLFDKTNEYIEGSSSNNGNSFNNYHKSNRFDMKIIRDTLEGWFSKYPEVEKNELKIRFKKDFDSAFFELFLYELFKKLGYEILIHPKLKNSKKRPDFLITKNGKQTYVEAKICFDKTEAEMALENLQNEFYDKLSNVKIKGFLLAIEEVNFITKKQPRVKELIAKIENEVAKLDPIQVSSSIQNYGYELCPKIEFENKDFNIIVKPIPLIESEKDTISENPIGIFPFESFWGGGEDSLRQSILKKSNRYGKFEIPYLICINALGKKTSGKTDIENLVWGSLQYTYSTSPNERDGKLTRKNDGIFYNSGKAQLKNVSGLIFTKIFPSNIPNAKYWMYKNPFANNNFNFEDIDLVYSFTEDNQIISAEGTNLDIVFEISKDWLTE